MDKQIVVYIYIYIPNGVSFNHKTGQLLIHATIVFWMNFKNTM